MADIVTNNIYLNIERKFFTTYLVWGGENFYISFRKVRKLIRQWKDWKSTLNNIGYSYKNMGHVGSSLLGERYPCLFTEVAINIGCKVFLRPDIDKLEKMVL